MELSTVTVTVPTEYLPGLMRVVADLVTKGVTNYTMKGRSNKSRHRDREVNKYKIGAKTARAVVSDLKSLSSMTQSYEVKARINCVVEKILEDVASEISGDTKVDQYLVSLGENSAASAVAAEATRNLNNISKGVDAVKCVVAAGPDKFDQYKSVVKNNARGRKSFVKDKELTSRITPIHDDYDTHEHSAVEIIDTKFKKPAQLQNVQKGAACKRGHSVAPELSMARYIADENRQDSLIIHPKIVKVCDHDGLLRDPNAYRFDCSPMSSSSSLRELYRVGYTKAKKCSTCSNYVGA